jgi:hypothetical protein
MGKPEEKLLAKKFQELSEYEVTTKIIIPLFESLGYERVEYFGGASEEGKDIICWGHDELGGIELTVAQVKHYKPTYSASDKKSFETIVNQLANALSKELQYIDKSLHYPSRVYLISTFEVVTKVLNKRFQQSASLKDQQIKILDGLKLASLLLQKRSDLAIELLGPQVKIASEIRPTLNNEALFSAIGFQGKKDLKTIYTDIDFSLGKPTTVLFFNTTFKPSKKTFHLLQDKWKYLKSELILISDEFPLDFLENDISSIENDFQKRVISHNKWEIQIKEKYDEEKKHIKNVDSLTIKRNKIVNDIHTSNPNLSKLEKKLKKIQTELSKIKEDPELLKQKITLTNKINSCLKPVQPIEHKLEKENELLLSVKDQIRQLKISEPSLDFIVIIDGFILEKTILQKRAWIEQKVDIINKSTTDISVLKKFIEQCKKTIDIASILFRVPYLYQTLISDEITVIRKNLETTRLKLPIEHIFDTGLNLTVLGDAGAGKSTSLQFYALNRLNVESNKLFIFAPLGRVIQYWLSIEPDVAAGSIIPDLEKGIAKYLAHLRIRISPIEFSLQLETKGGVLLLDGIDEAIKIAPWLLTSIRILAEKYKNVQVITSSRMSGSYLEEIPFFAVTLLPFTEQQRDEFVEKWFTPEQNQYIDQIKKHLKKNKTISEIVKNPLLTTILCVLAENNIVLPNSEIKLYEERIRLLVGHYDLAKNIRRVCSSLQCLENLARKLAFYLHTHNKREEDRSVLHEISRILMHNELDKQQAVIALDELIDPCNILVPMTEDGKFGFGHLRFQEHLAGKELFTNRSIDLLSLMKQPWWRGVLILFAQMNEDLCWLIDEIIKKVKIYKVEQTLQLMIKARPKSEQYKLLKMVQFHSRQQDILYTSDDFISDDFTNDFEDELYNN